MAVGKLAIKNVAILSLLLGFWASCGCSSKESLRVGQVDGNSMEPVFSGERVNFTCPQCSLTSFFSPPPALEEQLRCPRCADFVRVVDRQPSDLIAIEPIGDEPLQIGDVIVFDPKIVEDAPDDPQPLQLKRIAGLPQQQVEIRDGDLWIDGNRHVAPTDQFLDRAILIDQTRIESSQDAEQAWITYVPSSLYPRSGRESKRRSSNLLDESPWDLSESREFHVVNDYAIELESSGPFPTSLELKMGYKGSDIKLSFNFQAALISIEVNIVADSRQDSLSQSCEYQQGEPITIALVDGVLRIYSKVELFRQILPESTQKSVTLSENTDFGFQRRSLIPSDEKPYLFALKADGEIPNEIGLKIFRDVHYRGPRGESYFKLAATRGYQVLGDHVAASLDSRQRYAKGIPKAAIVGTATRIKDTDNFTQKP